jgi:hypothetical protein
MKESLLEKVEAFDKSGAIKIKVDSAMELLKGSRARYPFARALLNSHTPPFPDPTHSQSKYFSMYCPRWSGVRSAVHFVNYLGADMRATIRILLIRWRKLILNDLLNLSEEPRT